MTALYTEETPLSEARDPGVSRQACLTSTNGGRRRYGPCSGGSRRHEYMSVGEPDEKVYPRLLGRLYGCVRRPWLALAVAVAASMAVLGWWTVGAKEIWIQEEYNSSGGNFKVCTDGYVGVLILLYFELPRVQPVFHS